MAYLVGEALMQAAAALPDSVLKQAPLLENIGLSWRNLNKYRKLMKIIVFSQFNFGACT